MVVNAGLPPSQANLTDQVIVITGGSRGIGRTLVTEAVRRGAKVAFCSRTLSEDAVTTLALADAISPGSTLALAADVTSEDDVDALFDAALDRFGRIDVAIHNAGINRDALLVHTTAENFDEVLAVNLTGAFLVARRAVAEFLTRDGGGRVLFTGSISQAGGTSQAAYSASKGGLTGLSRTIAKEYGARSITSNIIVAGFVETDLSSRLSAPLHTFMVERSALRRAGTTHEIATAALWLASPAASYVNGALLHASGGWVDVPW